MSITAKFEIENPPEGKSTQIACTKCINVTEHGIMTRVTAKYDDCVDEYDILQYRGCKTISFRKYFYWFDDEETYITIYPSRIAGRHKLKHINFLPPKVRKIYQETLAALSNEFLVLASIGIRAIVEAVCQNKSAAGGNLEKKIDNLVTNKFITDAGAEILHSLRFMGNDAAHEVKEHTIDELITAFDVVEHLLMGVYILPKHAKKLPKHTP